MWDTNPRSFYYIDIKNKFRFTCCMWQGWGDWRRRVEHLIVIQLWKFGINFDQAQPRKVLQITDTWKTLSYSGICLNICFLWDSSIQYTRNHNQHLNIQQRRNLWLDHCVLKLQVFFGICCYARSYILSPSNALKCNSIYSSNKIHINCIPIYNFDQVRYPSRNLKGCPECIWSMLQWKCARKYYIQITVFALFDNTYAWLWFSHQYRLIYGWNFSGRTKHGNDVIFFVFLAARFCKLEVWEVNEWNIFLKYISAPL